MSCHAMPCHATRNDGHRQLYFIPVIDQWVKRVMFVVCYGVNFADSNWNWDKYLSCWFVCLPSSLLIFALQHFQIWLNKFGKDPTHHMNDWMKAYVCSHSFAAFIPIQYFGLGGANSTLFFFFLFVFFPHLFRYLFQRICTVYSVWHKSRINTNDFIGKVHRFLLISEWNSANVSY